MNQQLQSNKELIISETTRCYIRECRDRLNIPWVAQLSEIEFLAPFQFKKKFWPNIGFGGYSDFDTVILELESQEFLTFLCRSINPANRRVPEDKQEIDALQACFNKYLKCDGWEIGESGHKEAGQDVFEARRIDIEPGVSESKAIKRSDVRAEIEQCKQKLKAEAYQDVIVNARKLLENCLADIYQRATGESLEAELKNNINVAFKQFLERCCVIDGEISKKLKTIVNDLSDLRNKAIHPQTEEYKFTYTDARTYLNITITILDYIYNIIDDNKVN